MVTSAKDWKGKANQAVELELPSGNTALVRNPGMQAFLQSGIVPNELMPIILEAMQKNEMPDLDEAQADPKMLQAVLELMDNILVYCVVEPPVAAVPAEGVKRDEDTLYADEVDMEDKTFIFQYAVGGTKDLEKFRKEQAAALESLPASPAVARPAKRAARPPAKRRR